MEIIAMDIVYVILIGIIFACLLCMEVQIKSIKTMIEERWLDHQEPLNGHKPKEKDKTL